VGGLVRRIDGRSVGRFFREVIAGPLNLDAWIGLPAEHLHRTGRVRCAKDFVALGSGTEPAEASLLATAIWANPPLFPDYRIPWNDPDHMTAEIPGAGGIADARSMARFYACLVRGETRGRSAILSPATLSLANAELSRFTDPFTGDPMAFGAMFAIQTARRRFGPPADAFGHGGAGQSLHGAWPGKGIGFSYVMRELRSDPEATRSRVLLDALWSAIDEGGV
jgi:CubicO group peptidase (beta-lactamase class C family)